MITRCLNPEQHVRITPPVKTAQLMGLFIHLTFFFPLDDDDDDSDDDNDE
jgi:hypothetical protein